MMRRRSHRVRQPGSFQPVLTRYRRRSRRCSTVTPKPSMRLPRRESHSTSSSLRCCPVRATPTRERNKLPCNHLGRSHRSGAAVHSRADTSAGFVWLRHWAASHAPIADRAAWAAHRAIGRRHRVSGAGRLVSGVIQQLYFPSITNYGSIFTPEQLWPITPWLGGQTLGQSVANGVPLLNAAINTELARGNPVTVWGTSQGSTVADLEIRSLMAQGSPNANQLSFILTGNPENPNGGILERFAGAYIPVLDLYGYGATPPNAPYRITMVTNEYDGVSDFPQYPLNLVSDLNAGAGFLLGGDHDYAPYPTAGTVRCRPRPATPATPRICSTWNRMCRC